jgi:hypothetical protein
MSDADRDLSHEVGDLPEKTSVKKKGPASGRVFGNLADFMVFQQAQKDDAIIEDDIVVGREALRRPL